VPCHTVLVLLQDPNPNNRLTTELEGGTRSSYECPHNIVQGIIKIFKSRQQQVRSPITICCGKQGAQKGVSMEETWLVWVTWLDWINCTIRFTW